MIASTYFKPFEFAPLPPTCKAKRTKGRSACQSYPASPIPRLTLVSSTCSSVMTSSSSPRHLFSLIPTFPSSSYSHSHVPHTLSRRLPPTSQNVFETTGLWCSLSLYEEDLNVYLHGIYLKTYATIYEEWDRRGAAMLRVFFGGGTPGNVRSSKKAISRFRRHLCLHE